MNSIMATVNNYKKGKKTHSYVDKIKTHSASSGNKLIMATNEFIMLYKNVSPFQAESIQEVYEANESNEEEECNKSNE